tara:strand:+ start:202 stop:399 length:198 start_codon:yes stop_codon:yes gene_type:complete
MNEEIEYSLKDLSENFEHFNVDIISFLEKGNKSAATRARKSLLEISKLCKDIRKQIQDIKNSSEA